MEFEIKVSQDLQTCSTTWSVTEKTVGETAVIEYLFDGDTVIDNKVTIYNADSEITPYTKELFGGTYVYNIIAIPVAKDESGDYWYNEAESAVYYNGEKVTTLQELLEGVKNSTSENRRAISSTYTSTCGIDKCFLNKLIAYLNEYLDNGCSPLCYDSSELASYKDLLIAFDYVIRYLKSIGDARIDTFIKELLSCDGALCPRDYTNYTITGGCGCGKSR